MKSKNTNGFTLVELIIVITILAILATIAFISFQSYTKDARNSKRDSDLNSISRAMEVKMAEGVGVTKFVSGSIEDGDYTKGDLRIENGQGSFAGTGLAFIGDNEYKAGYINLNLIGGNADSFKDPKNGDKYLIGATTFLGGVYELATDNYEEENITKRKTIGTYKPRTDDIINTIVWKNLNGTPTKTIIIEEGLGILKVGDTLFIDENRTDQIETKIVSIGKDLSSITLEHEISDISGFGLSESNDEVDSLICTPTPESETTPQGNCRAPS